jgi:ceramidase
MLKNKVYLWLGSLITGIVFVWGMLYFTQPIPQNSAYHNLVDQRTWLGIPNFLDVISNLPFAFIGWFGITLVGDRNLRVSWLFFFLGLVLLFFGSAYYHLHPNNQTLVWDRLPMTISFMSLFVALLSENIWPRYERHLLPVAILLGLTSVLYWHFTDDLRWYGLVQFGTLTAIPFIVWKFSPRRSENRYLLYGLGFYVLAKLFEWGDRWIFSLTGQTLSGHTIKHLVAAAATYCVYRMLQQRQTEIYT